MGTRNLTRLNVALTATIGPFASAMKGAGSHIEEFGKKIKDALLSPLALITEALTVGAFVEGIKKSVERINELAKSADRLGISTESFAGLGYAAKMSGASVEMMEKGMVKLTDTVEQAKRGNLAAAQSITRIGLTVDGLLKMNPDERFRAVADGIKHLGTTGERTASTIDLLGKKNIKLLNTLELGSKGLEEMQKEAEKLGIAVSRVDAAKVEEAGESFRKVGEAINGMWNKVTIALAPFFTMIADGFTNAAISSNDFGLTVDRVQQFVVKAAGYVADAWYVVQYAFLLIKKAIGYTGEVVFAFADAAAKAFQFIVIKIKQMVAMWKAEWDFIKALNEVFWNAVRIPVAIFIEFVGKKLAEMLREAADVASFFDDDLAASITSAADKVQNATAGMTKNAKDALAKGVTDIKKASSDIKTTFVAMFSAVELKGNATAKALSTQFFMMANKANDDLGVLKRKGTQSSAFQAYLNERIRIITAKAQDKADDIKKDQDESKAKLNGQQTFLDKWDANQNANREKEKSQQQRFNAFAMQQADQFLGNLSALQNSHSKKAREVGKAAAKVKIVIDTASAAMGAYSALASIPYVGPALGIAAAAAAMAAGAVQLGNVDKSDSGSSSATASAAAPASSVGPSGGGNNQSLVIQGQFLSAESLVQLFDEARERGIVIDRVRRG